MKYPNTPTTHNLQPTTLITGGTGFVGSHLVEELLHRGEKNIVVTNYSPEAGCVGQLLPKENIVQLDLTNRDETFELIQKLQPKKIFHLASIAVVGKSFDKASHIFQNNITLQLNLLEAVRQHSPDSRMLIIGSGAEYGKIEPSETITEETLLNPIDPYAVSKVTQDLLALHPKDFNFSLFTFIMGMSDGLNRFWSCSIVTGVFVNCTIMSRISFIEYRFPLATLYTAPGSPFSIMRTYALTTSLTSVKSRIASRLPTISFSRLPCSISTIWLINAGMAKSVV